MGFDISNNAVAPHQSSHAMSFAPMPSRFNVHFKSDVHVPSTCISNQMSTSLHYLRLPSGVPPPCKPGRPPNPPGKPGLFAKAWRLRFCGMGKPWSCFCNCARSMFIGGVPVIPCGIGNPCIAGVGVLDCDGGREDMSAAKRPGSIPLIAPPSIPGCRG